MRASLGLPLLLSSIATPISALPLPQRSGLSPRIGGSGAGSTGAAGTMGMYAGFTPPFLSTLSGTSVSPTATTPATSIPSSSPTTVDAAEQAYPTGGSNQLDERSPSDNSNLIPRMFDAITQHLSAEKRDLPPGPNGADGARGADGNPGADGATTQVAAAVPPPAAAPGGSAGPAPGFATSFIQRVEKRVVA